MNRLFVVLACYLLSGVGIFFSIAGAMDGLKKIDLLDNFIAITWIAAWIMHATLSFNWIIDNRLGKKYSIAGTALGLISIIPPFNPELFRSHLYFLYPIYILTFVLPCFLLAIKLVLYHYGHEVKRA